MQKIRTLDDFVAIQVIFWYNMSRIKRDYEEVQYEDKASPAICADTN